MALSHPVSVAWARELVGAGKARVREHRHPEAPVGGIAPAELAPEAPREDVPVEEAQPAEESAEEAEVASASEEEDTPSN